MVGDVLGKHHKGNRHISYCDSGNVGAVKLAKALEGLKEGEFGQAEEAFNAYLTEGLGKRGIINNNQRLVSGGVADYRKYGGNSIACKYADYKGNKLGHFLAEYGAQHYHSQGDKAADYAKPGMQIHNK